MHLLYCNIVLSFLDVLESLLGHVFCIYPGEVMLISPFTLCVNAGSVQLPYNVGLIVWINISCSWKRLMLSCI
jgi:hypothetical protein